LAKKKERTTTLQTWLSTLERRFTTHCFIQQLHTLFKFLFLTIMCVPQGEREKRNTKSNNPTTRALPGEREKKIQQTTKNPHKHRLCLEVVETPLLFFHLTTQVDQELQMTFE